jgi:hypothetical protein
VRRGLCLLILTAGLGCDDSPTSLVRPSGSPPIERLQIFVTDWPDRHVEIDFRRQAGGSTLVMFRPPQPGVPRVLLDSIGPNAEDPEEIVELLRTFNVWALADSNAAGAACSTKTGQWVCNPTFNDYTLVMAVDGGGTRRAQRYTGLGASTSNQTARALGDFVFAMMRRRESSATPTPGT